MVCARIFNPFKPGLIFDTLSPDSCLALPASTFGAELEPAPGLTLLRNSESRSGSACTILRMATSNGTALPNRTTSAVRLASPRGLSYGTSLHFSFLFCLFFFLCVLVGLFFFFFCCCCCFVVCCFL